LGFFSALELASFAADLPILLSGFRQFVRSNSGGCIAAFLTHANWPRNMAKIDQDAEFARLLHEAHRELFGFIFAMLQNSADAEDVYQQCAVVLWKKFATFKPGTNFIAWAIRIAQYEIKDFVKARRRRKVYFTNAILDAIAVTYESDLSDLQKQRIEALGHCLDKLTDWEVRLLKRCYAVDRDYGKIAEAEGKTVPAIYKAISRIRKSLYLCVQRVMAAESR
jgi:RNA polymerase sigma-70 factor (ECF subfamily)